MRILKIGNQIIEMTVIIELINSAITVSINP